MTEADIADCRNCLCLASRKAARAITAAYDRRLRPYGVRTTQFTILTMLMLRGESSIGELANILGMDRTTLTRNVALLESNGWAESRPDAADSRAHIISVTGKGRALVRAALPDWRKAQESTSAAFGPNGVAALRRLAATVIQ